MFNRNLKEKIMIRVYLSWFFKKLSSSFALEIILFAGLFFGLTAYVSLVDVFNNLPSFSSPGPVAGFFWSAFYETETVAQVLFAGMVIAFAFLFKDIKLIVQNFLLKKKQGLQFAGN